MNNRPEPQFHDLHTGYRSPIDHAVNRHGPSVARTRSRERIAPAGMGQRNKAGGWIWIVGSLVVIGALADTFMPEHYDKGAPPEPKTVIRPSPEPFDPLFLENPPYATPFAVDRRASLPMQAQRYFHAHDYGRAAGIYQYCAQQGDAECQRSLGYLYSTGQGVPKDDSEAFRWTKKAAEQGNAVAQDDLGVMYGDGRGVQQDWVESFLWISRAAAQGLAQARDDAQYVLKRMTPAQRVEALKRWNEENGSSR